MKRDMDAVRALLLGIEASPNHLFMLQELIDIAGGEADDALGLIQMLQSGGYLETSPNRAYRMTWAGYEFLETIRDPEIWQQTKSGASKVGSWSVGLLAELAKGYIRAKAQALGLPIVG